MRNRNPFLKSLILAAALGSLIVPTIASAQVRPHGGGGHAGGHSGFHGGARSGHAAGGYHGGRSYGGNWGGGGYYGGYYGGYCGPIQLTLGLCGPFGL